VLAVDTLEVDVKVKKGVEAIEGIALILAFLLSSPAPRIPEDLIRDQFPNFSTFKLNFGEDEVVFLLRKDQSLRDALNRVEKRSLEPSSVEVKRSPLGGLGLFATRDFMPGELVLSERPLVSASRFQ
jgi:hypothetical protein